MGHFYGAFCPFGASQTQYAFICIVWKKHDVKHSKFKKVSHMGLERHEIE